ncbi:hypothetical protein O181_077696 [Austropuccinia psidii MF-1]|uniref:Uncharacterized protein n=1 Tax=Austropuccinia psidii MF-1 TaxID=1389203 RepID=A0A9Q3FIK0_9BASI|nr:hypothetical protein [Austropuccinia psidii MF-1]
MPTSIIPAITVNSEHNITVIIAQNNQAEPTSPELMNLDIIKSPQKANNLADRASYNPSSSSQKAHRHDDDRSQSVMEQEGSVNESQTDKLFHSEADNTVLPSDRAYTSTRTLSGHIQIQPEGLKQCLATRVVGGPFFGGTPWARVAD